MQCRKMEKDKRKRNKPTGPVILIDTREQRPLLVGCDKDAGFAGLKIEFTGLKTGDYSVKGMESPNQPHSVCIERKSLADLFLSLGKERDRFEREFARMSKFDHAELVIEADWEAVFFHPPEPSEMKPKAVYRSLVAWSQRYGVPIWACPGREFAERHVFITLQRFWQDRQENGKMEFCKI